MEQITLAPSGKDNPYRCQDLLSPSLELVPTLSCRSSMNTSKTQQNTFTHGHRASELGVHVRTAPYKPCRLEIGGTAKDPAVACMPSILAITKQRGSIALISRLEYCRSGKACTWQQTGKLVSGVSERRRLDTCGERDRTRSSRCSILQARRNCTPQPWRRPAVPTTACRLCRLRKVLMLGFT